MRDLLVALLAILGSAAAIAATPAEEVAYDRGLQSRDVRLVSPGLHAQRVDQTDHDRRRWPDPCDEDGSCEDDEEYVPSIYGC